MTIKQLINNGEIKSGDELVWNRRGLRRSHRAVIESDGMITTQDGKRHKTPSGAAKHLNDNKPVDGWLAWRLEQSGRTLHELRMQSS